MSIQNVNFKNISMQVLLILSLLALGYAGVVHSQSIDHESNGTVKIAQSFLRALYPELSGKEYALTVVTAVKYDEPWSTPLNFYADVGGGPKYLLKSCCLGGTMGGVIGAKPSLESQKLPDSDSIDWDAQGRGYPKQFLHTYFSFDQQGRLVGFTASGPAVEHTADANTITALVNTHPETTDAKIADELKRLGGKYGPADKAQFVKDLPLKALAPFLGKLELVSVDFPPIRSSKGSDSIWLLCTVNVLATRENSIIVGYKLTFDQLKGNLIRIVPAESLPTKENPGADGARF